MNLFDKNRNDLSKYFYDLSKAVLISYIAIPIIQGKIRHELLLAGITGTMLFLSIGMVLKKGF